jgi:hypothetical protein
MRREGKIHFNQFIKQNIPLGLKWAGRNLRGKESGK